jgi:hypothetical protein
MEILSIQRLHEWGRMLEWNNWFQVSVVGFCSTIMKILFPEICPSNS